MNAILSSKDSRPTWSVQAMDDKEVLLAGTPTRNWRSAPAFAFKRSEFFAEITIRTGETVGDGTEEGTYSSTMRWAFAPPAPNELIPARRAVGPLGQGLNSV